jgi:hypothetical protein
MPPDRIKAKLLIVDAGPHPYGDCRVASLLAMTIRISKRDGLRRLAPPAREALQDKKEI